jgi:predicted nucleotidyltransferase
MSRFVTDEPDFDRYEPKQDHYSDGTPVYADIPDFDTPEPIIDPAENAMHSLIDALTTLEQQIVLATQLPRDESLRRLNALRKLTKRAEQHATLVHSKCADAIDRAMERIR